MEWESVFPVCFAHDESELLRCSLLAYSRWHFSSSVDLSLSQATSLALLASNTCFEMTYSYSETLSASVGIWERDTEREFVVSRAFSLAPEALAKSAVRFGSLLSTLHIQSYTHKVCLSLLLILLSHALTHPNKCAFYFMHSMPTLFAFLTPRKWIQLLLMVFLSPG